MIDNWTNADLGAHAPTVPGTVEAYRADGWLLIHGEGEGEFVEGEPVEVRL